VLPSDRDPESLQPQACKDGAVLEVTLPGEPGSPVLTRSFAACLAAAMEIPVAQVPLPRLELHQAVRRWRSWLAARGVGLVPIAGAAKFNWPGYWIAVIGERGSEPGAEAQAVLMFGSPSGVVLSPQDPDLLGQASLDLPVEQGYVVANFDPALPSHVARPRLHGIVEAVAIAEVATGPMRLVEDAQALPGRGLAGDRYAEKAGTFTPPGGAGSGYDLTLIQAEVLDDLLLPGDKRLGYAEARRNVVTRGIDVNSLVGRRFRIGDVECVGQRLCEPCAHLERLTHKGVLRGLIHRGGLRADILSNGTIRPGSVIETID
jgi:MOSC domain-containing protein YiiM